MLNTNGNWIFPELIKKLKSILLVRFVDSYAIDKEIPFVRFRRWDADADVFVNYTLSNESEPNGESQNVLAFFFHISM